MFSARGEIRAVRADTKGRRFGAQQHRGEGRGRGTDRDYRSFVLRARGSLYEIETQAVVASRLGYVSKEEADELVEAVCEMCRIVNGLIRDLTE